MREFLAFEHVGNWERESSRKLRMIVFAFLMLGGAIWFAWVIAEWGCFCDEYDEREE